MFKVLLTRNLHLTVPTMEDLPAIIYFEKRNRDHLAEWESSIFSGFENNYTLEEAVQKRLENWIKECEEGKSVRFFMRPIAAPDLIIGFCNFTQIFHGSFRACYLGYKIDYEYEGKGLMFEALEVCIRHVFEELGIHRIMANYIPINSKSAKLLDRLGFEVEGYAKNYLQINNRWEDHILTALSHEQWQNKESKIATEVNIDIDDVKITEPVFQKFSEPFPVQGSRPSVSIYIAVSIDGYIARQDGGLDWLDRVGGFDEDYGFQKLMESIDAVVLGRKTYEVASTVPDPYPGKRVIVLSRSLDSVKAGMELYGGDLTELRIKLQKEGIKHLWVDGGSTISQFLSLQLVDEMTLSVIPIILGSGIPLFHVLSKEIPCRLISSQSYRSGLVQLHYAILKQFTESQDKIH